MKRLPTIKEVAHIAGVSTATVSNVLQGKDTLYTHETAARVWQAAQTLDYRPNLLARSLVRRRTHTLGIIVPRTHGRLTANSYLSMVLDGFLYHVTQSDYQIKIISLKTDDPAYFISQIEDGTIDGAALFGPANSSPLLDWAQTTRLPTVVAGNLPPDLNLPCVDVDDLTAERDAVRWLIAQGHQRIGIIAGPADQWSARRRETGYKEALQEADIAFCHEWLYRGDYSPRGGEQGVHELLSVHPPLTALVCGNDWTAIGALKALQERGVSVPSDIALLGFDDIEAARWAQPALTTIRQPMNEIGRCTAEMLLSQIEHSPQEPERVLLSGQLIVRQSVALASGDGK